MVQYWCLAPPLSASWQRESEDELNVSTRMNDIMNWSREMFNSAITVTENDSTDIMDDVSVNLDTIEKNM